MEFVPILWAFSAAVAMILGVLCGLAWLMTATERQLYAVQPGFCSSCFGPYSNID